MMRIYLVGFMGCGKSTLGLSLASEFGLCFIDLDKYMEERNYKSVPQLFADYGEEGFRQRERNALEEVSEFTNVVVATGGGAPCFYDNMDLMNRTGVTLFLDVDSYELADRLIKSKTERPLIRGKSKKDLIAFIHDSLKKRLPRSEERRVGEEC